MSYCVFEESDDDQSKDSECEDIKSQDTATSTGESWAQWFCSVLYPLSEQSARSGAPRLDALEAPRWIASIKIVAYHFYDWDMYVCDWCGWGEYWTQFFFMLSGFVLAYIEMAKPPQKGGEPLLLQYVFRRLVAIYPCYLFSYAIILFNKPSISRFEWTVLPLHLLLMQAWLPICSDGACSAWVWNGEAWFMSVLVVYWLLLRPITSQVRNVSRSCSYALLIACSVWPLVHQYYHLIEGASGSARKHVVYILVYASPAAYFHVFIAGILSARIFILSATCTNVSTGRLAVPILLKYGCCVGYLLYVVLAVCEPPIPDSVAHNGGLIPIMFLVIMGAAVDVDPLTTWIFRSLPFITLGKLSFAQYLMQRPVWDLLRRNLSDEFTIKAYPFILVLSAYLVQRWIGSPYAEWNRVCLEKDEKGAMKKCIAFLDDRAQATLGGGRALSALLLLHAALTAVIFW